MIATAAAAAEAAASQIKSMVAPAATTTTTPKPRTGLTKMERAQLSALLAAEKFPYYDLGITPDAAQPKIDRDDLELVDTPARTTTVSRRPVYRSPLHRPGHGQLVSNID